MVGERVLYHPMPGPSIHFRGLAMKYMEQAMYELEDEPLSLPLLQTLILNTHCLLVQGVRGRAWRYLGLCIRTAYELNLHLIDAGKHGYDQTTDVQQWCIDEEWRRAWWAIWEMDVFASVIRRCPAGIDWTQNVTLLPAEDERWYRGEPQPSCFLEINVNNRWKSLGATKNESPKAWFIVINSMMKDAQNISSPTSIDRPLVSEPTSAQLMANGLSSDQQQQPSRKHTAAINRLNTVLNAQYCAVMALPKDLRYHGQYLNFGGNDVQCPGFVSQRLTHCAIYSIHLMAELTKLMVLKYHIFPPGSKWILNRDQITTDDTGTGAGSPSGSSSAQAESHRLVQYFEAADAVVNIIRGCCGDHYKHVNPFLASTAWLAGAVQLLRRSRLPDDHEDRELATSNFEVVCLTYRRTVEYWMMSKVPLSNWETLESALEAAKANNSATGDRSHYATPCVFSAGNMSHQSSTTRAYRPLAVSKLNGDYNSINDIFKYMKRDGDAKESLMPQSLHHDGVLSNAQAAPQQFPLFQTSNSVYATGPSLTEHSSTQQPITSMTSSEQSIGTGQVLCSISNAGSQVVFSPAFLDSMPFTVDRHGNIDFSITLDEMFSGSYLP
ncbi:hypothetical protein H2200_011975 [Cladophialophora chaetospira]|uniref:Xylanolytic transcriptional activator regulatory domain-containing protein n=1 Tax=Cladophialophora chaetospira TaxID=386627 RepID=A0AA38WZ36_9EURO|nr:hypothetical protein H2200_011975 [Cladophialophora chaetospira]